MAVKKEDVQLAQCQSCGCPMVWAKSPKGANMPLDARAVIYELVWDETGALRAVPTPGYYVSHFSTCKNASVHSKGGHGHG